MQALFNVNDFEEAKTDFSQVLEQEPDNKAAKNWIIKCDQKVKQYREREKQLYKGMFAKMAKQDAAKVGVA